MNISKKEKNLQKKKQTMKKPIFKRVKITSGSISRRNQTKII